MTLALVAEPYSSGQVREGAERAVLYSEGRVPRAGAACPGPAVAAREEAVRRMRMATDAALRVWAMNWT